jgi:hypothetical protein
MSLLPNLNKVLAYVQEKLSDLPPSDFEVETGLKSYPSVKRKMLLENVRDPSDLSDLARGRVFFSDQFDFSDVIDIIKQLFDKKITKIQKKDDSEHGLEYQGVIHADLDLDGIKFELQIIPSEYRPYVDFLHQIYERFRDPKKFEKLSDKQQELLKRVHNKVHKDLHRQTIKNRAKVA